MERVCCAAYMVLLLAVVASSEPCEQEGEIRLSGGASPLEGRVDWCRNGQWGAVCDTFGGWNYLEARVVCRQVGRQLGVDIFTGISRGSLGESLFNREPPTMFHQNQAIMCSGDEESLADCPTRNYQFECTDVYSTVGVTCVPSNTTLLPTCSEELQDYQLSSVPFACPRPVNGSSLCLVNSGTPGPRISAYNEFVCNGKTECGDCSDECHCFDRGGYGPSNRRKMNSCRNSETNITVCNCTKDEFQCANGFCVPNIWRCDGQNGCGDNSDEINDYCKELRTQSIQRLENQAFLAIGISFGLAIGLIVVAAVVLIPCVLLPRCLMRKLYTATPSPTITPVGVAADMERGTEGTTEETDTNVAPLVT